MQLTTANNSAAQGLPHIVGSSPGLACCGTTVVSLRQASGRLTAWDLTQDIYRSRSWSQGWYASQTGVLLHIHERYRVRCDLAVAFVHPGDPVRDV
jgi:hypothetical protein